MGKLKNHIDGLIEAEQDRGIDSLKIAQRLIEAGMGILTLGPDTRIVPSFEDGTFTGYYLTRFTESPSHGSFDDAVLEMRTALKFAGELFDGYARNHLAKFEEGRERADKAQRNIEAAVRMFAAIGEDYTPPAVPTEKAWDDWKQAVKEEAGTEASGSTKKLLSDIHIAEIAGEPLLGVRIHLDDQPVLSALLELGYLNRDDVSDKVTITTKGKDAIGVRPEGVPDLPVEVAEITGNIEERELSARYIDAKIKGVEKWIAENPASASKHDYEIMARILIEIANEFRIGMHLPNVHLEGRVIPYNEDRSTGLVHADAMRTFFEDVYARNLKAGWWTDIETGEPKKRNVGELFILFITEIAEAYESWLVLGPDDKLPHHPGIGVELADLGIRWADFCGALLAGNIVGPDPARNPGDAMFKEIVEIAKRYESIRKTPEAIGDPETAELMPTMDVAVMIDEKLKFNAKREDHRIENRLKADGKRT